MIIFILCLATAIFLSQFIFPILAATLATIGFIFIGIFKGMRAVFRGLFKSQQNKK